MMKEFKTISERALLYEAQHSLLNRMLGALEALQEGNTENKQVRYNYFKFVAAQYEEMNVRSLELEKCDE